MPAQHEPNSQPAMKKLISCAALALCLLPAAAFSQGNCFQVTTQAEQEAGAPEIAPVDHCGPETGGACFRQSFLIKDVESLIVTTRFTRVESCTKDDLFDDEVSK